MKRISSVWATRATLIFVVLAVSILSVITVNATQTSNDANTKSNEATQRSTRVATALAVETARAQRAECESINASVDKIRLAVVTVAGYQAPIREESSPELRAQIETSNIARRKFAEAQAASIPGVVCPGDESVPTTTTTHP